MGINIAVDNDEILFDLISALVLFHNEVYGTNFIRADFFSYQFNKVWGGDIKDAIKKVEEFFDSDYFKNIQPIPGALETMNHLKERGHNLFVVTGRILRLTQKTEDDLKKYFPNVFSGLCFANTYGTTGIKLPKSILCRKLNSRIIIDDDLIHINECSNAGIKVLAYDCPWNQEVLPENATRVYNWKQVKDNISTFALKTY